MNILNRLLRPCAKIMLVPFAVMTLWMPAAHAGLIGTHEILDAATIQQQKSDIDAFLSRQNVADQLAQMGVNPDKLQARVAALSDAEIAELHGQVQTMPAGSGVLELAVFVFLVLLVTDILGFTSVFPFIKKTVQ